MICKYKGRAVSQRIISHHIEIITTITITTSSPHFPSIIYEVSSSSLNLVVLSLHHRGGVTQDISGTCLLCPTHRCESGLARRVPLVVCRAP
ncbi:hypothetical protein E2C01_080518 [Portunus trituberculatus]|uniref:Uncharacterized protein n=1 Tax=Portunus trituberculatus TaxID=210409 RepID=A0A5B7IMF5_PORTR|nr:hypothetical protein [Portunus trituberculatus]